PQYLVSSTGYVLSHTLSTLFFFSSRRRHTCSKRDWSSDVCSSDLYFCHSLVNTLNKLKHCYLPRFLVQSLLSAMLAKLLKFKSLRSILACCNRIIARTTYSTCKSCFLYCHKTTPKLHLS